MGGDRPVSRCGHLCIWGRSPVFLHRDRVRRREHVRDAATVGGIQRCTRPACGGKRKFLPFVVGRARPVHLGKGGHLRGTRAHRPARLGPPSSGRGRDPSGGRIGRRGLCTLHRHPHFLRRNEHRVRWFPNPPEHHLGFRTARILLPEPLPDRLLRRDLLENGHRGGDPRPGGDPHALEFPHRGRGSHRGVRWDPGRGWSVPDHRFIRRRYGGRQLDRPAPVLTARDLSRECHGAGRNWGPRRHRTDRRHGGAGPAGPGDRSDHERRRRPRCRFQ